MNEESNLYLMSLNDLVNRSGALGLLCFTECVDQERQWRYNTIPVVKTGYTYPGPTGPWWWYSEWTDYESAAENTFSVTFNCCCTKRPAKFNDTAKGKPIDYDDDK
jgi:hypothetical protein